MRAINYNIGQKRRLSSNIEKLQANMSLPHNLDRHEIVNKALESLMADNLAQQKVQEKVLEFTPKEIISSNKKIEKQPSFKQTSKKRSAQTTSKKRSAQTKVTRTLQEGSVAAQTKVTRTLQEGSIAAQTKVTRTLQEGSVAPHPPLRLVHPAKPLERIPSNDRHEHEFVRQEGIAIPQGLLVPPTVRRFYVTDSKGRKQILILGHNAKNNTDDEKLKYD